MAEIRDEWRALVVAALNTIQNEKLPGSPAIAGGCDLGRDASRSRDGRRRLPDVRVRESVQDGASRDRGRSRQNSFRERRSRRLGSRKSRHGQAGRSVRQRVPREGQTSRARRSPTSSPRATRTASSGSLSGKRIMIEFSSPNTNKPLHLGHLRNDALGESISRILKFCGADVFKVNIIRQPRHP